MAEHSAMSRCGPRRIPRRPLVLAAILFMGGIVSHRLLPIPIAEGLLGLWILLVGSAVSFARPRVSAGFLALFLFGAGVVLARLEAHYYPRDDIAHFTADEPRLAQLEMVILDPPRLITTPADRAMPSPPRQFTSARVVRILTRDGWRPACGEVLVHLSEVHAALAVNQRVRALGMLSRPAPADNPGQFDWAQHYRRQRITASLSIAGAGNMIVLEDRQPTALQSLRAGARRLLAEGFPAERAVDHALLLALLLGDRHPEIRDIQDDFTRTGTGHHLSTSGLHVSIVALVIYAVSRLLRLHPRRSAWLALGLTLLYGAVTLPSTPILRSVVLAVTVVVGIVHRRAVDVVHLLALSALILLAIHPLDLYHAGFQLSFGTVLGMMLLTSPIEQTLAKLWPVDIDILVAQQFRPMRWRSLRLWWRGFALKVVSAALAAWVVSAPLIAAHFDQLNPWTMPASIALAVPVFLSVVAGVVKIVLTLVFPSLSWLWAWIALQPVAAMRHMVDWLATWPGADVPLPAPRWWFMAMWYLCLAVPVVLWGRHRSTIVDQQTPSGHRPQTVRDDTAPAPQPESADAPRTRWWLDPAWHCAAVLVMLAALHIGLSRDHPPTGAIRLTLLSVGAGQCAVLELPDGRAILFDAGSDTYADLHRKCLDPFLRRRGIRRIDALFLSHPNTDHFIAAGALARTFGIRKVYVTHAFIAEAKEHASAQAVLDELAQLNCPAQLVAAGDQVTLAPGVTLDILWPPGDLDLIGNDASLVMALSYAHRRVLLPGDIQIVAQRELLAEPDRLPADVLISPHHGSAELTTEDFLAAVSPQYILSSNDRTLTGKQRRFDALAHSTVHLRTHRTGAVTVTIHADSTLDVSTFR